MGTLKTGERLGRNGLQQIKKKFYCLAAAVSFLLRIWNAVHYYES
jgi:hypothetical protein